MNWDAVVAVSEVIGVIGLILSIGYLGIQARQGNRVAIDAAFQGVFSLALAQNRGMVDGKNPDIVIKGLTNYSELVGSEKLTFDLMMLNMLTVVESALLSNEMELLDDEQPDGFAFFFRTRLLPYNGIQAWWKDSKEIFDPTVQDWVATEIEKADSDSGFFRIKKNV